MRLRARGIFFLEAAIADCERIAALLKDTRDFSAELAYARTRDA
ncbi:hypothetical protein [Massilia varians]|nr:hypothetical protein [Massilia varians]